MNNAIRIYEKINLKESKKSLEKQKYTITIVNKNYT